MSFILSNAVVIPFLGLVAAPLLLHLFARSRPPAYQFSSIEFILRIVRSTMRVKRPQDWLLLLIRTLLFAAVVLLFLQPVFFSKRKLASPFEKKNVVLVVDATASMAYADGAQSRFAAACAEASEILSGLSSKDTANIIWLDSAPDSVFPEMGVNLNHLQSVLRRARVTSEAGDIAGALRLAASMVEEREGKHEICIISDFQKTAWENTDYGVPSSIDLINVKVGTTRAENKAIIDIQCDPPVPLVGEETTVFCEVRNYAHQSRRVTVFLNVEESRRSQELIVPAWEEATAIFKHRFTRPGSFPITVSLGEDPFTGDDRRWAIVEVRGFLRAGILAQESATALAWNKALRSVGWARTEILSGRDLDSDLPFDVIMLSGWDGSAEKNLRKRLEEGCTIVCSPADGAAVASVAELAGSSEASHTTGVMRREQSSEGRRLTIADKEDGVFQLFASGEYGDPSRGVFHARLNFPRTAFSGGKVLFAYDDGVPALVKFKGKGHMFLWNMPLDSQFSNWARQVEFLPFLAEMLLTSRSDVSGQRQFTDSLPGQLVTWHIDRDVLAADINLRSRDGNEMPIREHRHDQGVSFVSETPPKLGLYMWEHQKKLMGHSVVNFPVIESDLRVMPLHDVEKPGTIAVVGGSKVRQLRDGINLWPHLLTLAIFLLLIEGATLLWVERT